MDATALEHDAVILAGACVLLECSLLSSAALARFRVPELPRGYEAYSVFVLALLALTYFVVSERTWKFVLYGVVIGMLALMLAMLLHIRIRTGQVFSFSNQADANAAEAIAHAWVPYIFIAGSILSAVAGVSVARATIGSIPMASTE
jgi:hypothetical protein